MIRACIAKLALLGLPPWSNHCAAKAAARSGLSVISSITSCVVRLHQRSMAWLCHHFSAVPTNSGIARVEVTFMAASRPSFSAAIHASMASASSGNRSLRSRACAS